MITLYKSQGHWCLCFLVGFPRSLIQDRFAINGFELFGGVYKMKITLLSKKLMTLRTVLYLQFCFITRVLDVKFNVEIIRTYLIDALEWEHNKQIEGL